MKHARNWMRLAATYFPQPLLLKAAAYMCAYCYCLKAHLRQGRKRKDPNDPTAYRDDPTQVQAFFQRPAAPGTITSSPSRCSCILPAVTSRSSL